MTDAIPALRPCVICKLAVDPVTGIKANTSDRWVHTACLDMRRERALEERRVEARRKVAGVVRALPRPRDDDDAALLQVAPEPLQRFYAGWTRKVSVSALIIGLTGSCKTLTLAAKARDFIGKAVDQYAEGDQEQLEWVARAIFVTSFSLAEATRQHPLGQGECPIVTKARTASLLILDDLGNEVPGFEKLVLSIIDSRIGSNLPSWVTSGFSVDLLNERYGQALTRRLCEKGTGALIDLFKSQARRLEAVR